MSTVSPIVSRARHSLGVLGEFVYVVDAFAVALLVIVIVIAGVSPFVSTTLTVLLVATLVVTGIHHYWYQRNRNAIEHDPVRVHARERRGF